MATQIKSQYIEDNAVITAKIADLAIETAKIADSAIESTKIASSAVNASKIANGAVETAKLADAAISAAKIAAGAVETAAIADEAITGGKIALGVITSSHLDGNILTDVLETKLTGKFVFTGDLPNPSGSTMNVTNALGFNSTAGVDPFGSSKGKTCLLEASGGVEFNTSTGKVGSSAVAAASKMPILDTSGNALLDSNGQEVWAVITTNARTTSGTYTCRFFSGEFGSGNEAAFTMSSGFMAAYSQLFDLNDMPTWDTGRSYLVDKEAAQLVAGQITSTELASNAVTAAKIASNAVTEAKIDSGAVTSSKIGAGAVEEAALASNAVTSAKIASGAINNANKFSSGVVDATALASASVESAKLASEVKARIGGGWDAFVSVTGNGSTVNLDLGHSDAENAEEALMVIAGGLFMEYGVDYTFSDNAGAGGVDRIVFDTAPANGAKVKVFYRRTSL